MPKEILNVTSPLKSGDRHILVCHNTSCLDQQAIAVLAAFQAEELPPNVNVYPTQCQGQCSIAATVRIVPDETWYCRVKPEDVPKICEALRKGEVAIEKLNPRIHRRW